MQADGSAVAQTVMLTRAQVNTVRRILAQVLPGADVRVFGSRATGRARPFSDLDLLLVAPAQLGWDQRADLRDAFDASELPFRVDVVEARDLPEGMDGRVADESVPLRDL